MAQYVLRANDDHGLRFRWLGRRLLLLVVLLLLSLSAAVPLLWAPQTAVVPPPVAEAIPGHEANPVAAPLEVETLDVQAIDLTLPPPAATSIKPFDRPELVELRAANARHFDLGDGRFVALVSATPLNYRAADGSWQPIDARFAAFDGGWQVRHNSLRSTLMAHGTAVQLQSNGFFIGWQPQRLLVQQETGQALLAETLPLAEAGPGRLDEDGQTIRYAAAWSDPGLVETFVSGPGSLKQSLILPSAPALAADARWLSLQANLAVPTGLHFYADGQVQKGSFSTAGPLDLRDANGQLVLRFAPVLAYEEAAPQVQVNGRYVVQHQLGSGEALLTLQTPAAWWSAPGRQYPAVFDPTMQVIQDMDTATINVAEVAEDLGIANSPASVSQNACVGHFVRPDSFIRGFQRAYVKFPLPTLPQNAQPGSALLVAVPDPNAGSDPTYGHYPDRVTRQLTFLHQAGEDWSSLLSTSSWPINPADIGGSMPALAASSNLETLLKPDPGLGLTSLPATTWDVSSTVQDWYTGVITNYGFALRLQAETFLNFEDFVGPAYRPTFTCFPTTAQWSNLNPVLEDPDNAFLEAPGLGLLITYTAPDVQADEFKTYVVPSANPKGSFVYQYHEYDLPVPNNNWQLVAAQGALADDGLYANTPLDLANGEGEVLASSDAGTAAPGLETYDWQPNYLVLNGNQALDADLRVRVQPDNQPAPDHNDKLYYMQTLTPEPAPVLAPFGVSTTVEMEIFRELIAGQILTLAEDRTIEIRIPYDKVSPTFDPRNFDVQLFPPGIQYGSRTVSGAPLIAGPDAYEIEVSVPAGQAGDWLLVANSNISRSPGQTTLPAEVTVCENSDDVVRYPLKGQCLELRRPPATLNVGATYQELGNLRLYSPAGFSGDCNTSCTTNEQDAGTPVMPLIGFAGDDDHWVALKGGTFTLDRNNNRIDTSPDTRLVMADFSSATEIVSLPVLRGQFEATPSTNRLVETGATTYLLVKSPMHAQDDATGWRYEIDLPTARMEAQGDIVRTVQPTDGYAATNFNINADWSITAAGGPSLQGNVAIDTITGSSPMQIGTLLLTAPDSGYSIEYDPRHVVSFNPAALPPFRQIRFVGATIAQPDNMGAAALPVQGVMLPPGQGVKDQNTDQVVLQCGVSCLDLRNDEDAMTQNGPLVNREYRMPDLIIQDSANTVMFNTGERVEIFSSDHPMARPGAANDLSFNYEAFGGSVRTFRGACPGPRDPLDPDKQGPDGPETTVVVGSAGMVIPNAGADGGDLSGGPQITAEFTLCEGSLREMKFIFSTGEATAIPLGNSGLFLNFIGGTISLSPQQPGQEAYTTVVLDMRFRGMSPAASSSTILSRGVVTIDSRGLFDVQVQTGVRVFSNIGVGVDGHFWVAWSPLDLGFEVEACVPYNGFDPIDFPSTLCEGDELLFGSLRAHLWQGQGWQNKYHWLPDDDSLHIAARFEAKITIKAGLIIDWGPAKVPPGDITLLGIKLAFGEFCMNNSCTEYEWGVMGAFTILGYDVGAYYGFDSGISFILGSADYVLIDEAGRPRFSPGQQNLALRSTATASQSTISLAAGTPSAMFGLGALGGAPTLTLYEPPPGNRVIDASTVAADVTVTLTPTTVSTTPLVTGVQTIIVVDEPLAGDWVAELGNTASATDYRFFFFANQPQPQLAFGEVPMSVFDQTTLPLTWTSSISAPDAARLSLYYELVAGTNPLTSGQEVVGPIVERLPLTSTGRYTWNIEGLYSGSYRVWARVDNNAAAAIESCGENYSYNPDPSAGSCGVMLDNSMILPIDWLDTNIRFRLRDTIPPAPPQGIDSRPEDVSSVVVRWEPNQELDLSGYVVTCEQGTLVRQVRVPSLLKATSPLSESARVNGLNAEPADCVVQAYDVSFNLSTNSLTSTVTPSGTPPLPPATVQNIQLTPVDNNGFQVTWAAVPQVQGYLVYYQPILATLVTSRTQRLAATSAEPPLTGSYQANEGPSPLKAAGESLTLTGLRPGTTYEVFVRAYDADGRTSAVVSPTQITIPAGPVSLPESLYLPLLIR